MPSQSRLNIHIGQNGPRRPTWYEIGMKYDRLGSLCNLELFWGTFAPTPKIIPSCKGSPNGHISYLFHTKLPSWGHFVPTGCLGCFGMASGSRDLLRPSPCDIKAGFVSVQREERKTPSGGGTLDPKTPGRVIGSRVPPPRRREGRHRRWHP